MFGVEYLVTAVREVYRRRKDIEENYFKLKPGKVTPKQT
jgi:hypothetical protein